VKDGDYSKKDVTALCKWSQSAFFPFAFGVQGKLRSTCSFSLETFFLVSHKLVPASARPYPARYCEIDRPDKLNFPI
jgi:hypothetical protein